uniref:Uncharacterized protein n=1 Tax=Strigamia maritima TaxID=126957 RepID=T1JHZ7_STRMM
MVESTAAKPRKRRAEIGFQLYFHFSAVPIKCENFQFQNPQNLTTVFSRKERHAMPFSRKNRFCSSEMMHILKEETIVIDTTKKRNTCLITANFGGDKTFFFLEKEIIIIELLFVVHKVSNVATKIAAMDGND